MINKKIVSALIKTAHNLDLEQNYDKADEVTGLLERVAEGDKEAIKTAQSWLNNNQSTAKDMNEPQLRAILQKAMAAHRSGQSGWKVLNSLIANLPAARQTIMKQLFMTQTGEYGTNPPKPVAKAPVSKPSATPSSPQSNYNIPPKRLWESNPA